MLTLRVAELSELPPGKGRVVESPAWQVTVYNLDGKFHAAATRRATRADSIDPLGRACAPGGSFDVFAEHSPARLRADAIVCALRVRGTTLYADLPD